MIYGNGFVLSNRTTVTKLNCSHFPIICGMLFSHWIFASHSRLTYPFTCTITKVLLIKFYGGLFSLSRIWNLGSFGPVGQSRIHTIIVIFIIILSRNYFLWKTNLPFHIRITFDTLHYIWLQTVHKY